MVERTTSARGDGISTYAGGGGEVEFDPGDSSICST